MNENNFCLTYLKISSQSIFPKHGFYLQVLTRLGETDPVEFSVVCNCIMSKLPFKGGMHNYIQTFLKVLKIFTDFLYEMCPNKMRLPCRCFEVVGCYERRNYERSWKYNSVLCPGAFWHSYHVCCQTFYSWGRAVL